MKLIFDAGTETWIPWAKQRLAKLTKLRESIGLPYMTQTLVPDSGVLARIHSGQHFADSIRITGFSLRGLFLSFDSGAVTYDCYLDAEIPVATDTYSFRLTSMVVDAPDPVFEDLGGGESTSTATVTSTATAELSLVQLRNNEVLWQGAPRTSTWVEEAVTVTSVTFLPGTPPVEGIPGTPETPPSQSEAASPGHIEHAIDGLVESIYDLDPGDNPYLASSGYVDGGTPETSGSLSWAASEFFFFSLQDFADDNGYAVEDLTLTLDPGFSTIYSNDWTEGTPDTPGTPGTLDFFETTVAPAVVTTTYTDWKMPDSGPFSGGVLNGVVVLEPPSDTTTETTVALTFEPGGLYPWPGGPTNDCHFTNPVNNPGVSTTYETVITSPGAGGTGNNDELDTSTTVISANFAAGGLAFSSGPIVGTRFYQVWFDGTLGAANGFQDISQTLTGVFATGGDFYGAGYFPNYGQPTPGPYSTGAITSSAQFADIQAAVDAYNAAAYATWLEEQEAASAATEARRLALIGEGMADQYASMISAHLRYSYADFPDRYSDSNRGYAPTTKLAVFALTYSYSNGAGAFVEKPLTQAMIDKAVAAVDPYTISEVQVASGNIFSLFQTPAVTPVPVSRAWFEKRSRKIAVTSYRGDVVVLAKDGDTFMAEADTTQYGSFMLALGEVFNVPEDLPTDARRLQSLFYDPLPQPL